MKKTVVIVVTTLAASLLVFVLALGTGKLSSNVSAEPPSEEVVIFICGANFGVTPPPINVQASSSSANAPAVTTGTACAQALANVLAAGFDIENVQSAFSGSGALYTLVK